MPEQQQIQQHTNNNNNNSNINSCGLRLSVNFSDCALDSSLTAAYCVTLWPCYGILAGFLFCCCCLLILLILTTACQNMRRTITQMKKSFDSYDIHMYICVYILALSYLKVAQNTILQPVCTFLFIKVLVNQVSKL